MSSNATRAKIAVGSPSARTERRSCSARHSVDLPEELGPVTRIATGADSELAVTARYRMHSMNATGGTSMNVDQ